MMSPKDNSSRSEPTHRALPSYSPSSAPEVVTTEHISNPPIPPRPQQHNDGSGISRDNHRYLSPVDDGGFPEAVVLHEPTIDLKPDIDYRTIHQQQCGKGPKLPSRHSTTPSLPSYQSFKQNDRISTPGGTATVTPLHHLGDSPDAIDCPFCLTRSVTRIKKKASMATHVAATGLFFTTIGGAILPYAKNWGSHISHYCSNCDRKVAERRGGSDTMQPVGTPEHLREVSRYQAAV